MERSRVPSRNLLLRDQGEIVKGTISGLSGRQLLSRDSVILAVPARAAFSSEPEGGWLSACHFVEQIGRPGIRHDDACEHDKKQWSDRPYANHVMPVPFTCSATESAAEQETVL